MNLDKIINFEGKRNCSLTLFIPNNSLNKSINYVEKAISSIKHDNKRKQLIQVIQKIKKETKSLNTNENVIICCGLDQTNSVEFFNLTPKKEIIKLEYFYDYKFHINKIYEFIDDNVEMQSNKELISKYLQKDELLIYEKELEENIIMKAISCIYWFNLENPISSKYIDLSKKYNFKIKIICVENHILKEYNKRYGNVIGILYNKN